MHAVKRTEINYFALHPFLTQIYKNKLQQLCLYMLLCVKSIQFQFIKIRTGFHCIVHTQTMKNFDWVEVST